jgi:hypothetical protein
VNETTATRSYRPGQWFGIFGSHATVLLPPSEKARVAHLWSLVDEGAGFDVVLDTLISDGLRELRGFVLVSSEEGETKVVIRGAARAWFTTGDETVEVAGSSATTWAERSLSGVEGTRLLVEDDVPDGPALLIDAGLVRVAEVVTPPVADEPEPAFSEGDVEASPPAPLVAPEPETEEAVDEPDTAPQPALADPPAAIEPPALEPPAATSGPVGPGPTTAPPAFPPQPPAGVPSGPPPPVAPPAVDHDGLTQGAVPLPPTEATPVPPPEPDAGPAQPEPVPAPASRPVARLVLSNGETVEVDRAVLVGRAPEARRFTSGEQPRLVTVPSPAQEISSTHLEIRPGAGADHGTAVVTDLGSTNGTVVVQPGLPPEDLQPGIAVQLVPGAIIDLGDGVTIQVINP